MYYNNKKIKTLPAIVGIVEDDLEIKYFEKTGNVKSCFHIKDRNNNSVLCVYWGVAAIKCGQAITLRGYRNKQKNCFVVNNFLKDYTLKT
jgi:hypothetical protein